MYPGPKRKKKTKRGEPHDEQDDGGIRLLCENECPDSEEAI